MVNISLFFAGFVLISGSCGLALKPFDKACWDATPSMPFQGPFGFSGHTVFQFRGTDVMDCKSMSATFPPSSHHYIYI